MTVIKLFGISTEAGQYFQKVYKKQLKQTNLIIFSRSNKGSIYFDLTSSLYPKELFLKGWLISYQSGGSISPHMHEESWITGSVYINIPKRKMPESGNLVLCLDAESQHDKSSNLNTSLDVVTGSICLFPASLLHYTIPFESSEDRIVLAFDLIPKGSQIA